MTNLVRWDPFSDLRTTMDRVFDEGFGRPRRRPVQGYESSFPIEVSQTEDELEVKASLPGMRPEDVEITVAKDVLTIKAAHREEAEDKKRDYYRREIRYGSFQRSMGLPVSVDSDKASATFENGILTLRLPKSESLKPKQIRINGSEPAKTVDATAKSSEGS